MIDRHSTSASANNDGDANDADEPVELEGEGIPITSEAVADTRIRIWKQETFVSSVSIVSNQIQSTTLLLLLSIIPFDYQKHGHGILISFTQLKWAVCCHIFTSTEMFDKIMVKKSEVTK